MSESNHLSESTGWIELGFVDRDRTPCDIIEKGIRYHLTGLSLSNTVTLLGELGVERSLVDVHHWVQKSDL